MSVNDNEKKMVLAGEFVLGTLDDEERARFEEALRRNPDLEKEVEAWQLRLGALDQHAEKQSPPEALWSSIEAAVDKLGAQDFSARTIRVEEGEWIALLPGVQKKLLHRDPEAGVESYLLKMAPGSRLPPHYHGATEECMMIEGEAFIGDVRLVAGDYHVVAAGTSHPEIFTEMGSLAYIRGEIHELAV